MRISAKDYFKDANERIDLHAMTECAGALEVGASAALIQAAQKKIAEITEDIDTHPRHDRENLKKDLVYMLGEIHGLKWLCSLPGEAKRQLAEKEQ